MTINKNRNTNNTTNGVIVVKIWSIHYPVSTIQLKGGQKNLTKMGRSVCQISLATNMLGGWGMIHLKGETHTSKNFSVQYHGAEI